MDKQTPEAREALWRRKLSEAERAALLGQPELELEARLTEALRQLPDAPVPSNFSARVLQAVDLEEARSARARGWGWDWHWLLPRLAVATAIVLVAGVGLQQHQLARHRANVAPGLSRMASVKTVPSVDALENLDVIQPMSQPAHSDPELLADLDLK